MRLSSDAPLRGAFVGRAREISLLGACLDAGRRLVTITGPAGIGKTRLALEWARSPSARGAHVAFCDLSEARTLDDACAVVARAIGAPLSAGGSADDALGQIGRALAAAGESVLLLDNLEQLVALAPPMILPWLALAPEARIVATSRERLRLDAEVCLPLEPLAVPPEHESSLQAIGAADAVALFVARARAVRVDFELTEPDAGAVAAIVRRLDGIPLAVELCAARIGVLAPKQILARLARRFELLGAGARGAPARQATLRGAIDWSWDLLDAAERRALAQCSVFRGGFSLDAAEGVIELGAPSTSPPGAPPPRVLDVIQALHDKSLIHAQDVDGARRYRLLESIRAYAEERLDELGADAALRRHAAFYLSTPASSAVRAVAVEADNLVAVCSRALAWSDAETALRALLRLEPVCARGRIEPYAAMLDAALAAAPPEVDPALRARGLYTRALADLLRGRVLDCMLWFQRALDAARAAGARAEAALCLTKIGLLLDRIDQTEEARRAFDEARAIALDLGDAAIMGDFQLAYCGALMWRGRTAEAAGYAEQALATLRAAGDLRGQSIALAQLAQSRLSLGALDEAERAGAAAVALFEATDDRRTEGHVLGIVGRVEQARGRFAEASAKLAASLAVHRAVGDRWAEGVVLAYVGNVAFEEGRLDAARSAYVEATEALRGSGERHYTAMLPATLGAVEIALGRADAAAPYLRAATRALEGVSAHSTRASLDVLSGFGDLAEAQRAAQAGDAAAAARHRQVAAARIARARSPAPDGGLSAAQAAEDVRFAIRVLEQALATDAPEQRPAEPAGAPAPAPAPVPTLVVGPEARWFRVRDREPVRLLKARAARLVLFRLARSRLEAPGRAISLDALFEAGWPGERIARHAAANRVHVTLSKLRQLGLAGVLQSRDDGFLLDPASVVLEALDAEPGP